MGIFCLVLHTHLPYVRRNGTWPSGEDFFHQAATEAYLPLLDSFERLHEAGVRDAFTLSLSPMIAHQMQDEHMLRELGWYLGAMELRTLQQVANYEGVFSSEFKDLAAFYAGLVRAREARLDTLEGGGIVTALDALARAGLFEIIGGPATHPFLPRVSEPSLVRAQVALGATEYVRTFGRAPEGMWLPECAYKPGIGIEQLLASHGIGHVVVDGPTMLRSGGQTDTPRTIGSSGVVAFARDLDVTYRVWSPTGGYPTGRWYRDFFHYDTEGGFKNWRVTSIRKPVERKRPYEPAAGEAAARADADDFAELIRSCLDGRPDAVVVAAYDTELFGHWWFEGPIFLEHLLTTLARLPGVRPLSLAAARAALPEAEPIDLVEGSWGFRKDDRSWFSEDTEHLWKALGELEHEVVRAAWGEAGARADALDQMLRETMLAQASDWPFMIIRGRNPDYARERFESHRARALRMMELGRPGAPDETVASEVRALRDIDNILPTLRAADHLAG